MRSPSGTPEDCQLVSNTGRRRLRSADVDTCIVLLTRTHLGDRSFSVAGPQLWNSLPAELRQPECRDRTVQTASEDVSVCTRLRRIATFLLGALEAYLFTYLLYHDYRMKCHYTFLLLQYCQACGFVLVGEKQ